MKLNGYIWEIYWESKDNPKWYTCSGLQMARAPEEQIKCVNEGVVIVDPPEKVYHFDEEELEEYVEEENYIFFRPKRWVRKVPKIESYFNVALCMPQQRIVGSEWIEANPPILGTDKRRVIEY